MGTWRTLHTRRILQAPDAISVPGNFRQASLDPKSSGRSEESIDWATAVIIINKHTKQKT